VSMIAAIDVAVRLQLLSDGVALYNDYSRVMGPNIGPPAADPAIPGLGFDETRLKIFLSKVARRLKFDTPPLNYEWTTTSTANCLTADRETMIEIIAAATTEITDSEKKTDPEKK
jgi:hypothetical protein